MSTSLYPLASLKQIEKSPSCEDGIPDELEQDLRAYGCKLIHEAGILLRQYVVEFNNTYYYEIPLKPFAQSQKTSSSGYCTNSLPTFLVCHLYEAVWNWCTCVLLLRSSFDASCISYCRTSEWERCTLRQNLKSVPFACETSSMFTIFCFNVPRIS